MKVIDLMRDDVRTVADGTSMTNAIESLVEAGVSALPVLDQLEGPIGVLTSKDILRAEAAREPSGARRWLFETTPVREVMSPWPLAIAPEADVQEAARMMLYLDLQRLFVVERGRVVGVISQTDIVDAVATGRMGLGRCQASADDERESSRPEGGAGGHDRRNARGFVSSNAMALPGTRLLTRSMRAAFEPIVNRTVSRVPREATG